MKIKTALSNRGIDCKFKPTKDNQNDLDLFLANNFDNIYYLVQKLIKKYHHLKIQLALNVKLGKFTLAEKRYVTIRPWFCSSLITVYARGTKSKLRNALRQIIGFFDGFIEQGSGWILDKVLAIRLKAARFKLFKGGCKGRKLPLSVQRKKACVTVQCEDNKCFLYSVLAGMFPVKYNSERTSYYDLDVLNVEGLPFPLGLKCISKFESCNDVSVNVFMLVDNIVVPAYITTHRQKPYHVNLLLYKEHYYTIRSLSRLLSTQSTVKRKIKKYICNYCLCSFPSAERLFKHEDICQNDCQRYDMPSSCKIMKFKEFQKGIEAPFVIYYDFEAINEPIHMHTGNTLKKTIHKPVSFCAMRVSSYEPHSDPPFLYRGSECMENFLLYLRKQKEEINKILTEKQKPMIWDEEAKERAKGQNRCYICNKKLLHNYERYRDHDHLSGCFRGISCNICNLKYSSLHQLKIPLIAHNSSRYDQKFLIRELHKVNERVTIIPKNTEQYLAIQMGPLLLIDSFQFMNESLDNLAKNLRDKGKHAFKYVNMHIQGAKKRELLLKKGVFCYSYLDNINRFKEGPGLPKIENFFNELEQEHLSNERYKHAQTVWKEFKCENLGDYHDIYLKSDLLILADVFQNFRHFCLEHYKLDAAHYLTGPQLSYDALLKMTGVQLELLSDIDMYNMIEKGIRGGVAQIMQRWAQANNKYMENYDPNIESSYLFYIDQNSLYSYVMQEHKLPVGGFEWLDEDELETLDPMSIPDEGNVGYIFEVTLKYPKHLHSVRAHMDFPLACDKMRIEDKDISPLTKKMRDMFNMKTSSKAIKLVPNFHTKHNYTLHYRNLKLYLELGLHLVKIHRAIRFKQRNWMAPYVRFNIAQRQKATSSFESTLFKLFNNAIFGKTVENLKKRRVVKLVTDAQAFENLSSKPTFRNYQIIHKNLAGMHMTKPIIVLDRPIYVGFSILDLAKLKMYDFHFRYMANKYGGGSTDGGHAGEGRARLIFTDTDSFIYWIQTEDLYADIAGDDVYDFSNYPKQHPLYSTKHQKEPGWMKDESAGGILESFVGLRSKMYSIRHDKEHANKDTQKAKGIKKSAIRTMKHDDYLRCLLNMTQMKHSFHAIRSQRHNLYTIKQKKVSLSAYDDKRYILKCNIHSLPYGHKFLKRKCDDEGRGKKYRRCKECENA